MYKLAVPVTNENVTRCTPGRVYEEIKKFSPDRIFISVGEYETDPVKREKALTELRVNCEFFKSRGFEVGVWIWAFMMKDSPFTCMKSLKGTDFPQNMCPWDENFLEFAASYARDMARTGVDIIMYDDDLRYGFLGESPACVCRNHLKKISEAVGEDVTAELICEKVHSGGKNKYRDAYLKANGDAFRNFARRMREAVDEINPDIRMGACACLNSWDIDGVEAEELARIFAGKNKPFFRLIGAPYWAALNCWGISLQDSIELSRMECAWTKDRNIEIFSEGDVYPRPRTLVPASYLEGFDTALRAAGCTDGILKYGMDYVSDADYETGYSRFHLKNQALYENIGRLFGDKEAVGVRVYEAPAKLSDAVFTEEESIDNMFFSLAARTLSYNTIPTVYEGEGITGAVFGENARHLTAEAFRRGLILDIKAALILNDKGIDTGISLCGEKITAGSFEVFTDNGNRISTMGAKIYDITLKNDAEALSFTEKDGKAIPMSYYFENGGGQKFFVLNIVPDINNPSVLRHYERNRQYREAVFRLSGEQLPAQIGGHPALYMHCKKGETGLAVGLWNFFADAVYDPEITLDGDYSEIEFINCTGTLCGNKVLLSDITPYAFAGFVVR